MLRAWTFDIAQYRSVAAWLQDNPDADPNDAALSEWLSGNDAIWSTWVTEAAASAIRDALDDGELPDGWPDAAP